MKMLDTFYMNFRENTSHLLGFFVITPSNSTAREGIREALLHLTTKANSYGAANCLDCVPIFPLLVWECVKNSAKLTYQTVLCVISEMLVFCNFRLWEITRLSWRGMNIISVVRFSDSATAFTELQWLVKPSPESTKQALTLTFINLTICFLLN